MGLLRVVLLPLVNLPDAFVGEEWIAQLGQLEGDLVVGHRTPWIGFTELDNLCVSLWIRRFHVFDSLW
jgi:hypothetical protein